MPNPMPLRWLPLTVAAGMLLAGCVTPLQPRAAEPADPVAVAVSQPLRDLSLIRTGELPAPLQRAAAAPYRVSRDCAEIAAELQSLAPWLGPDVDAPSDGKMSGGELAGELVSGATGLPFRGLVRRISGAHDRDKAAAAALVAAMVRRGFLNGERTALGCDQGGA